MIDIRPCNQIMHFDSYQLLITRCKSIGKNLRPMRQKFWCDFNEMSVFRRFSSFTTYVKMNNSMTTYVLFCIYCISRRYIRFDHRCYTYVSARHGIPEIEIANSWNVREKLLHIAWYFTCPMHYKCTLRRGLWLLNSVKKLHFFRILLHIVDF